MKDRPFVPLAQWAPVVSRMVSPGVPGGGALAVALHELSRLIIWDGRCPGRKVCEAKAGTVEVAAGG